MQQVVMEDREEQELLLTMEAEEAAATRVTTATPTHIKPFSWVLFCLGFGEACSFFLVI